MIRFVGPRGVESPGRHFLMSDETSFSFSEMSKTQKYMKFSSAVLQPGMNTLTGYAAWGESPKGGNMSTLENLSYMREKIGTTSWNNFFFAFWMNITCQEFWYKNEQNRITIKIKRSYVIKGLWWGKNIFFVLINNFLIYANFVVVVGSYAFANIIIMSKIEGK